MVDYWTYRTNAVNDPRTSDTLQRSVTIEKVLAYDQTTVLTPLDSLGNPIPQLVTTNDGQLRTFRVARAANPEAIIWLKLPGIDDLQDVWPLEIGPLLASVASAAAAVAAAQTAAESANTAAQQAAQVAQSSDVGTLRQQLMDGTITARAQLEVGSDANGSYIDPTPGTPGDRIYYASAADVSNAVSNAGSVSAQPDTAARRNASGQILVADPTDVGQAATKGYVDTKVKDISLSQIPLSAIFVGAYFNGTAYTLGPDGPVLTAANRGQFRVIFLGEQDPTTGTVKQRGDLWFERTTP